MDSYLRILQRQLFNEIDLSLLPTVLQQYIATVERLGGIPSVFNLESEQYEEELSLREAFMEHGGTGGLAGTVATRIIRHLERLGLPPTLTGLASADPGTLAVSAGMGYRSMAVAAEVLAAVGMLTEQWLDFTVKNRLYLEGRDKTVRRLY